MILIHFQVQCIFKSNAVVPATQLGPGVRARAVPTTSQYHLQGHLQDQLEDIFSRPMRWYRRRRRDYVRRMRFLRTLKARPPYSKGEIPAGPPCAEGTAGKTPCAAERPSCAPQARQRAPEALAQALCHRRDRPVHRRHDYSVRRKSVYKRRRRFLVCHRRDPRSQAPSTAPQARPRAPQHCAAVRPRVLGRDGAVDAT
jgi:hypothetical protein